MPTLRDYRVRVQTNPNSSAEHRTEPEIRVPLVPNRTGFLMIRVRLTEPEPIPGKFGFNRTLAEPYRICNFISIYQNLICFVQTKIDIVIHARIGTFLQLTQAAHSLPFGASATLNKEYSIKSLTSWRRTLFAAELMFSLVECEYLY